MLEGFRSRNGFDSEVDSTLWQRNPFKAVKSYFLYNSTHRWESVVLLSNIVVLYLWWDILKMKWGVWSPLLNLAWNTFFKICCINMLGHFLHLVSGQRLRDSNRMNFLENNSHSDVCVGGRTGSLHLCVFKSILCCTSFWNVLPTVSCNLVKSCQKNGNCDLCGLILLQAGSKKWRALLLPFSLHPHCCSRM